MGFAYSFLRKLGRVRSSLRIPLPGALRSAILDLLDRLTGTKQNDLPPLKLRRIIGQEEEYSGEGQVLSLRKFCGLKPNHRVLDVGSGTGRIASSLTTYLDRTGSYEGLEIISNFVDWCQKNITSKYPNFHFQQADVFSGAYNPTGHFKAQDYKFPFEDAAFDVVVLSSVFTHMLPRDLENYLGEIARVLKPGGCCWISYYLLNAETAKFREAGVNKMDFKSMGGYYTTDPVVPEKAIGYQEKAVLAAYKQKGLRIVPPIHYGCWSGKPSTEGFQDFIVAKKL